MYQYIADNFLPPYNVNAIVIPGRASEIDLRKLRAKYIFNIQIIHFLCIVG